MNTILKNSLAGLALVAASFSAIPATAQDNEGTTTKLVAYHDLNLSTEDGIERLNTRLQRAARHVCGMDIREPGRTTPTRQARECYADNMRRFDVQVAALVRQANLGG